MITEKDKQQLSAKGISAEQLAEQLRRLNEGFPFLKISAAASIEKGIFVPTEEERKHYEQVWSDYMTEGHEIVKFVPASGAASRMFKDLFAFLDGDNDTPQSDFERTFFNNLPHAAFYADLDAACNRLHGKGIQTLIEEGRYKAVVATLLRTDGLNYGKLPKGLLKFHSYADGARTPMEEHLVEGALYAKGADGKVRVHFTVSPEHLPLFRELVDKAAPRLAKEMEANYDISFSEQKSHTDTVASTPEGEPFRQDDGSLLFRPGGHGALIENLGDIKADVIFVKNIDNVVPDKLKGDTVTYKKLLAGILVETQRQAFDYLRKLDSGHYTMEMLREMLQFVQKKLCCKNPETKILEDTELAIYLRRKLNRPMRVCGMVRNVGEPGGGPFLAYNADGTISPQILESSQIDTNDAAAVECFKKGTHFNPVDLVCAVRDYQGHAFHLPDYVDPDTGFISSKSKDGRALKALELPGLWNGAMSDWNTLFVEVPQSTFNPVKTVNDLYRPQHQ